MRHEFEFRPNLEDELHCVPCAVGMALQRLTGEHLSNRELEVLCGFRPGKEVWQFAWMLGVAERGLRVESVEDFDPESFVDDPKAELLRGTQSEEVVHNIFQVSDVLAQIALVERCLASPEIVFETRVPTLKEVCDSVGDQSVALVNLNARALHHRDGYAGHLVLVDEVDGSSLTLQDPGPPDQPGLQITFDDFVGAWHDPSEQMANYIRVASPD